MTRAQFPNWLLSNLRKGHAWLGIAMSLCIVLVCLSGIYLNHKDPLDAWLARAPDDCEAPFVASLGTSALPVAFASGPQVSSSLTGKLETRTPAAALQRGLEQALHAARQRWGDTVLEKIEFKAERGSVVCRLSSAAKQQLALDLGTGTLTAKVEPRKGPKPQKQNKADEETALGKLIKNFHAGKLGGLTGKLLVDLTSVSILALTLSGLCLWTWPRLRRRGKTLTGGEPMACK